MNTQKSKKRDMKRKANTVKTLAIVPRPSELGSVHYVKTKDGLHDRLEPNQFDANPKQHTKYRYLCSNAIALDYTINELFKMNVFAATTTLAYSVWRAARIKAVTIWGPCTTQGTPVTSSLRPSGIDADNSFADLLQVYTDTSSDITRPAYVHHRFDKHTPGGAWHYCQSPATMKLFNINCPSGSVVDIEVEYVPAIASTAVPLSYTVAAAIVGVQYSLAPATGMIPQDVSFI